MQRIVVLVSSLVSAAALAALALAVPGNAAVPRLVATVGPGDSISVRTAAGAPVRTLRPGVYAVTVRDRSAEHNFRLVGPGVNKATSVAAVQTVTWKVRMRKGGAYRFVCDPHSDDMRGAFHAR
jgi:hypothetical protein